MKTKIVLWGTNAEEKRILVAMQLHVEDNKVSIFTFPESVSTDEFVKQMMDEWRNDKEVPFPEEVQHLERALSVTETILPDDIKVERPDLVQRAQTEWHFIVLSAKLYQVYLTELEEIKAKIDQLSKYDRNLWNELKEFWNKVQQQVSEGNLFRDHANQIRDAINDLFTHLKTLRAKMDEEFQKTSSEGLSNFMARLQDIEKQIEEGLKLPQLFEELKDLQQRFKKGRFTKEHRNKIWDRLDSAFKQVKEKRFGSSKHSDNSPLERIQRRFNGLLTAIEKMEKSIQRDRNDLDFQKRKIQTTDGQLEAQIRQAKVLMIEERIRSKEEKYQEMLKTKMELEKKMEAIRQREAKIQEREQAKEAREAAMSEAREKIAEKIKEAEESRKDQQEDLEKAAEALTKPIEPDAESSTASPEPETTTSATEPKTEPAAETEEKKEKAAPEEKKENLMEAISTTLGESLEDLGDTAKAVASVMAEKVKDAIDDMMGKDEEE